MALGVLLRWLLDPLWLDRLPYACAFLAFIIVSQFTEAKPAAFTCVVGFLLSAWFFAMPRHTLLMDQTVDRVNAAFYFAVCAMILYYTRRTRRAHARERAAQMGLARLAAIIESSDDAIVGRSLDGRIKSWNAAACRLYGFTEAEAVGQTINFPAGPEQGQELASLLERVGRGEHIKHFETRRQRKEGEWVEVSLSVSPVRNTAGQIIGISTIARNITERKKAERERERLVEEQQRLLGEVKTLSGLLPICSYCKKIRDDNGYWNQIEDYIGKHSSANFTHSVCPDCASNQYAEFIGDISPGQ